MQLAAATGAAGFAQYLDSRHTLLEGVRSARAVAQDEPQQGGNLRLGFLISQIVTLDPQQLSQGIVAGSILPSIFSSLVQFDEQLGLIPDLAESWTVSEDGLAYSFTLREGLTFHNGDPLTSADVQYTYERTTNPDFASPHANKLALVDSFEVPDERTVNLTLSKPFAPFLAVACTRGPGRALTPVPKRAVEELGDEQFGITPVGSGPFMVVPESVNVGSGMQLAAFDGWYGGRPYLDTIEVQLIPEPSSGVSALEAGDVDLLHGHHRLHGPVGGCAVRVGEQHRQDFRNDLPGHPEPIGQPAAANFLPPAVQQGGPQTVDLGLIVTVDIDRERGAEGVHRPGIQDHVAPSVQLKDHHRMPVRDDTRVGDQRDIELGGLLGPAVAIEPETGGGLVGHR